MRRIAARITPVVTKGISPLRVGHLAAFMVGTLAF
jgi:hypothetical protein